MICGLTMKKGTNIKELGSRRHHMRIAMQKIKPVLHTTSLNVYHHCTVLDIAMPKNNHNLTSKQQIV